MGGVGWGGKLWIPRFLKEVDARWTGFQPGVPGSSKPSEVDRFSHLGDQVCAQPMVCESKGKAASGFPVQPSHYSA